MKESRFIKGTIVSAALVFLLMMVLIGLKITANGIPVILIFLSIGLTLMGAVTSLIYWKKIGTETRVIGILSFLIWVGVVVLFFYGLKDMD